ncbi:unnamed protein product [Ixodes pacificus]
MSLRRSPPVQPLRVPAVFGRERGIRSSQHTLPVSHRTTASSFKLENEMVLTSPYAKSAQMFCTRGTTQESEGAGTRSRCSLCSFAPWEWKEGKPSKALGLAFTYRPSA